MRKGQSGKPGFSLPDMTGCLSDSVKRLAKDPGETKRVWHMANALSKAVAAVRADLRRLELMGLAPTRENAAFPYHPEPKR